MLLASALLAGCFERTCEPMGPAPALAIVTYDSVATLDDLERMFLSFGWNVTRHEDRVRAAPSVGPRAVASIEHDGFRVELLQDAMVNNESESRELLGPTAHQVVDYLRPRYGEPSEVWYSGPNKHCGPV